MCALLFFATTINYVDRQVLSMLADTLKIQIGWTAIEYSNITTAFSIAYMCGMLGAGRLLDKFGTRIGFAIAITVWSVAAMMHAWATSAFTFGVARTLLGLGESANFPACIKTVAEWFPKKERAHATGIFNSGSNIGAVIAPSDGAVAGRHVRLAVRVSDYRRAGFSVAGGVAVAVRATRRGTRRYRSRNSN